MTVDLTREGASHAMHRRGGPASPAASRDGVPTRGIVGRNMTIGVLQLELSIGDAMSLKDKRRVVKSLKDRIAHGHNVSIAEVGALDAHRRSILGIAMVSNDSRYVEGALSKLVDFVRTVPSVDLVDYQIELL